MRYSKWIMIGVVVAAIGAPTLCRPAQGATGSEDRERAAAMCRVLPVGKLPADVRLGPARTLNGYHSWEPYTDLAAWKKRAAEVREQVLVATGLWPMAERPPVKATIHGKIERDGYTVEKVFFASWPGHYVSGNLYRPKGKGAGPFAGVLSPHGHWKDGRFYDAGEEGAKEQVKIGAEKTLEGARYPLQARCAQLARMGCVVFHYDMVGVADSTQIGHTAGFRDVEAELRLQSFMGVQTFNSVRALDFLTSLPDVDKTRIGVTGASGGGTQTFFLCAIDDRPTVAFPAVMVSTSMQGGCVCENCSMLRVGTCNVEFAATFAPKPLAMSGADDWTIDIEKKGLPELKALYRLYGVEGNVQAKCYPQFKHNYNQVSREMMYNWMNRHLKLGLAEPVEEKPFVPVPPKELSVYDAEHPRPSDATDAVGLRKWMTENAERQMAALQPSDAAGVERHRQVVGTALRVMVGSRLPRSGDVVAEQVIGERWPIGRPLLLSRKGSGEQVPAMLFVPAEPSGKATIIVHPAGKAGLLGSDAGPGAGLLAELKSQGQYVLGIDVFQTGEFLPAGAARPTPTVDEKYAGYTFGYNRAWLGNRVHDILTAVAYLKGRPGVREVNLVGIGKAGPWVLLASALARDAVARTVADADQFSFTKVHATTDEMFLPGGLKYGDLPGLAALCAPGKVMVYNHLDLPANKLVTDAYGATGAANNLVAEPTGPSAAALAQWLAN